MRAGRWALPCALTLLLSAAAGCFSGIDRPPDPTVLVFVVDAPMDRDFVAGRPCLLDPSQVSHGSLVGRVLRECGARNVMGVPVVSAGGPAVRHESYLAALREVIGRMSGRPRLRAVVNISLASTERDEEEAALVRRIGEMGGLVVAAAGNNGDDAPMYPAAYPGVVAVAAATPRGRAPTSSYGPDVAAAASGDVTFIDDEFLPYEWKRRLTEAHGTSFAAPRVAAAVAWTLSRRPDLTPRQAWEVVRGTAGPIDDGLFARGMLGAGYVDLGRLRAAVVPGYGLVQFLVPFCVWTVMGLATAWLCLRRGLPGVFLSLVLWLIGFPATVLLFFEVRGFLYLAGEGDAGTGAVAAAILAAGALACTALQGWQLVKAAAAWLPPFMALVVLRAAGLVPPLVGATLAALLAAGLAVATERRVRRLLRGLERLDSASLIRLYRRSLDRRVDRRLIEALARVGDAEAVVFLLDLGARVPRAARAAGDILRGDPALLDACMLRYGGWPASRRACLDSAVADGELPPDAL